MGYIAGCIDGDGSFVVSTNRSRLTASLSVANTDIVIPQALHNITRIGNLHIASYLESGKALYKWHVGSIGDLLVLLPSIIPALVLKKRQAKAVLEFCSRRLDNVPLGSIDYALMDRTRSYNQSKEVSE